MKGEKQENYWKWLSLTSKKGNMVSDFTRKTRSDEDLNVLKIFQV